MGGRSSLKAFLGGLTSFETRLTIEGSVFLNFFLNLF